MAKIGEARELFQEKLCEMMYVERTLADEILPRLQEEVEHGELENGISRHLDQTRGHYDNLERVGEMLGLKTKEKKSPALDGMKKEHEQGMKDIEEPQLRDLFSAQSAAATEHYEISSYSGMITMAEAMGEDEAANLLRANMEQEQETLKRLETVTKDLTRHAVTA